MIQATQVSRTPFDDVIDRLQEPRVKSAPVVKNVNADSSPTVPELSVPVVSDEPISATVSAPIVKAPELPQEALAPVRLSELMVTLVRTEGGTESFNLLIEKLQSVDVAKVTERSNDEAQCSTLEGLLKLVNDPEKLQEAISGLDHNFCAGLKDAIGDEDLVKNYASLAAQLLKHGRIVGGYANASNQVQKVVLLALNSLSTSNPASNTKEYAQALIDFKNGLAGLIEVHNEARKNATNFGNGQAALLKVADTNFRKDLFALIGESSGIDKADAQRLSADLTAAAKQTKEDPQAAHTLNKYMNMMFSQEGAIGLAMLVPFLASILSGTLGELPFVGPMIKSICGLSAGAADMAQKLVQTMSIMNQAKTSKQVAAMQEQKVAPPPSQTVAA